jgi:hypothetical protein
MFFVHKVKISYFIGALFAFILFTSFKGVEDKICERQELFVIERSKDSNIIRYEVNLDCKGDLLADKPFTIYWEKTDSDKKSPLTWVQNTFAYGIDFTDLNSSTATFHFVSYEEREFLLQKDRNGSYKVYVKYKNRQVFLESIYIQFDGGSFWSPNIPFVELKVFDPNNELSLVEVIKPNE